MKKVISFLCAVSVMFSASAFSADVSALETLETTRLYFKSEKTTISSTEISKGNVTIPIQIYIDDTLNDIQSMRVEYNCIEDSSGKYVTLKNLKDPTYKVNEEKTYTNSLNETFKTKMTPFCYGTITSSGDMKKMGSFTIGDDFNKETGLHPDARAFIFTSSIYTQELENPTRTWLGATSDEYMLTEFEVEFAKDTPAGTYTISFLKDENLIKSTYCNRFDDRSKFYPVMESITFNVESDSSYLLGDIDDNGTIDAIDASLALTEYASVSTGKGSTLTDNQFKAADVNNDKIIDAIDASNILTYYSMVSTGKEPSFN